MKRCGVNEILCTWSAARSVASCPMWFADKEATRSSTDMLMTKGEEGGMLTLGCVWGGRHRRRQGRQVAYKSITTPNTPHSQIRIPVHSLRRRSDIALRRNAQNSPTRSSDISVARNTYSDIPRNEDEPPGRGDPGMGCKTLVFIAPHQVARKELGRAWGNYVPG